MILEKIYEVCEKVDKKLRDGYVYADVHPYSADMPVFEVEIHWGDWKHDHARAKWLISQMDDIGEVSYINSVVTEENGSDCYSAVHRYYVGGAYAVG